MGGGFGGRDHTPFPLYLALAAMFFPGRPVRLAHDRYQQFQGGIKRHAFKMRSQIGVDRATGKIRAFAADHVLDGGGLANFSPSVATVGAAAAIGIYDVPKVDVTTVALHSRGVTAGSMRGYGTLQTMTALEVLIDETAAALPLDPIEFRRRNALKTEWPHHDWQSLHRLGPHAGDPRQAREAPDLADRAQEKARARSRACSSARASPASPRITARAPTARSGRSRSIRDGRISIHCDHVEMGTAIGTALANRVAPHLGAVADEVTLARIDAFDVLGARHVRRSLHDGPEDAGCRGAQSALGAVHQHGDHGVDRRPCRHASGRRSRARHLPVRAVAGGARAVAHRADRPASEAVGRRRWKDGHLTMPDLAPLPLRRSRRRRIRATS